MKVLNSQVWMWAKFERMDEVQMKVTVMENLSMKRSGKIPPSVQMVGAILKALHVANGGSLENGADSRVGAEDHTSVAIPGGLVQTVVVYPIVSEGGPSAKEIWSLAVPVLEENLRNLTGVFGKLDVSVDGIEVTYGPASIFAEQKIEVVKEVPPPEGRIVELQGVLSSRGSIDINRR